MNFSRLVQMIKFLIINILCFIDKISSQNSLRPSKLVSPTISAFTCFLHFLQVNFSWDKKNCIPFFRKFKDQFAFNIVQ